MPAAAVIPAPGVHGIIAETKTPVVGINDLAAPADPSGRAGRPRPRPFVALPGAASVRVRDPSQVIKTSSCSMVLHGIVERTCARCSKSAGDDQREHSEAGELQGEGSNLMSPARPPKAKAPA